MPLLWTNHPSPSYESVYSSSLGCPSLLGNPRSNRPRRRTALVTRELVRYKVDIAALNKILLSEQGRLEEVGAGSRPRIERRNAGVAFAIRNDVVGRLSCLPQGINNRLVIRRLLLRGVEFTTTTSACAPNGQVLRRPARPPRDRAENE
ncbi:hypothetical protein SprV_0100268300 [Sparganum proliferum]